MNLKEQLQTAIDYCNSKLTDKGITEQATTVVDIGNKIAELPSGDIALEDVDIFIADFFDENTLQINKGVLNAWERIVVS